MNRNDEMKALLSSLSADFSAEELQLSILQGQIAAEISMRRQTLGLSQTELAQKLQVSQGLVSRWERGETNFNLSTLVKIASALDLKVQSPVVLTPPRIYADSGSNIYQFSSSSAWSGNTASVDADYHSSSGEADELEEM